MGKIIDFINICSKCKYEKNFSCSNKKYSKRALEIVREVRCPYFERRSEDSEKSN